MEAINIQGKRVIVVLWKNNPENSLEVFSNLKNFCLSYPQFNYNTLSNYLSKAKIVYENKEVRIERKSIILRPKIVVEPRVRKIVPVVRRVLMKDANDDLRDLEYWVSRPVNERLAAVTSIISESLRKGERMDKSKLVKKSNRI